MDLAPVLAAAFFSIVAASRRGTMVNSVDHYFTPSYIGLRCRRCGPKNPLPLTEWRPARLNGKTTPLSGFTPGRPHDNNKHANSWEFNNLCIISIGKEICSLPAGGGL
jgi:hypothetical protein